MWNERMLTGFAHKLKSDSPKLIIAQLKKLLKRQDIGPLSLGPMRTYSVSEDEDLDPKSPAWKTVKVMVTDGAAEFMGEELTTFCEESGIEKQASCPQNSVPKPGRERSQDSYSGDNGAAAPGWDFEKEVDQSLRYRHGHPRGVAQHGTTGGVYHAVRGAASGALAVEGSHT
jgi:hypothetical protein